jgi:alpha-beta hydrolase superfamily lysophospholipase
MWKENIEFLNQAKYLVDNGYSVLMYDFRNHGNSEEGTIPWVTWGPDEHKDVLAAVDFISKHPTYKNSDIGLLSICMGAAASTYAYGVENGLSNYQNIKAMIAVQPLVYPDFLDALGLPKGLDSKITEVNIDRTGIDLMKKSFVPDASKITVPTLLVQSSRDPYMNREMIETYYNNLQVEKEMLWLEELKKKRAAGYDYIAKNPAKVLSFFNKYM